MTEKVMIPLDLEGDELKAAIEKAADAILAQINQEESERGENLQVELESPNKVET